MTIDLDAITARHAAATPGPYVIVGMRDIREHDLNDLMIVSDTCVEVNGERAWIANIGFINPAPSEDPVGAEKDVANAVFVAHSWQDVADLIAEVTRLREQQAEATRLAAQVLDDVRTLNEHPLLRGVNEVTRSLYRAYGDAVPVVISPEQQRRLLDLADGKD